MRLVILTGEVQEFYQSVFVARRVPVCVHRPGRPSDQREGTRVRAYVPTRSTIRGAGELAVPIWKLVEQVLGALLVGQIGLTHVLPLSFLSAEMDRPRPVSVRETPRLPGERNSKPKHQPTPT